MTSRHFEPILDKSGEIIEWLMSSSDMPSDLDLAFKIRLAVEEAVVNIVSYAYHDGTGYVEVGTERSSDNILTIVFKDAGTPFNPLEKPMPDIDLPAKDRPVGGLGIYLCHKMMDELSYAYVDGCNVFTMKKNLNPVAHA